MMFPFNWDPQRVGTSYPARHRRSQNLRLCFHSIGIPSEWGLFAILKMGGVIASFHSIGIPSEWGLQYS